MFIHLCKLYFNCIFTEEKIVTKVVSTGIQRKAKKPLKRKYPNKIPEDWRSDDSDWEYSDEESNVSKKRGKYLKSIL